MEDKPLTESINKQYSKYGSLRTKEKESKIELCNAEDPLKFLTRIDSSIKDAKARVKQSIDKSTISEDLYESSYDQQHPLCDSSAIDTIPMVKIDRNKPGASQDSPSPSSAGAAATTTTAGVVAQQADLSTHGYPGAGTSRLQYNNHDRAAPNKQ